MRFVFAIVSFVIAAALIGAGIAQKTIFLPPDEVAASVAVSSTAPVTVVDGTTLNTFPRTQTLKISGSADVFAAYGRTTDVMAWVGKASYNTISYDPVTKELASKLVTGTEQTVPNPTGSDLWLAEFGDKLSVTPSVKVPDTISFVIVSNGTDPAPANIRLSWPIDNSTPWVTPLLIAGGGVLLVGLILLLWAITHLRKSRGPRRRQPKMPKLPKQPRYKPSKRPKALPVGGRGRRSTRTGMIALPIALASLVILSGCTNVPIPNVPSAAPADSTPAPTDPTGAETPAVTRLQAMRIVQRISAISTDADAKLDPALLTSRFTGPALELRAAAYKIKKAEPKTALPSPILDHTVKIILPQRNESWPRTVFVVVENEADATVPPTALMLIQQDPRAQYMVNYAVNLEPGVTVPSVAPESVGTSRVDPDLPLYVLPPSAVSAAYGDILDKGDASPSYGLFDPTGDTLRTEVGVAAKKKMLKDLPKTAKLTFSNAPGIGEVIVLSTIDSGAIVSVSLDESQTVKPVQTGASVNAPKGIKALAGKAVSTSGFTATYADQLLFYVPSKTVGGMITLLGYDSGLVSASELKKK